VAVEIEEFRRPTRPHRGGDHWERPSQKAIVIGARGRMLREIGTQARHEIERLLGCRVFLELFVRVSRDWSKNPKRLRDLGYR
jgi:GTP-binding protein Era